MDDDLSRLREAIITDDFGIDPDASDLSDLGGLREALLDAVRAKNRSAWIIGDAYLALRDAGEDAAQALDATAFSLKTAQNYASVCAAWPKVWRRVPVSLSHYEAAALLAREQPAAALDLLRAAYDGGLGREWVREQAALRLGAREVSIEVLLTWDADHQVFIPNRTLNLAPGFCRTLRLVEATSSASTSTSTTR